MNPTLFEEDSPWKVSKIIPLVDRVISRIDRVQNEMKILDVGGGAGLILGAISSYIKEKHNVGVDKIALDLSPGALEIQSKNNPDLKRTLNEDIATTSLGDKEIDLTLMIDVLEHVKNPEKVLREVRRISDYAIFKVPLDGFLIGTIVNFITRGKFRKHVQKRGHINIYTFVPLKNQIRTHAGKILDFYFTNEYEYYLHSRYYNQVNKDIRRKILALAGQPTYRISPRLAAFLFNDSAMFLVKCD